MKWKYGSAPRGGFLPKDRIACGWEGGPTGLSIEGLPEPQAFRTGGGRHTIDITPDQHPVYLTERGRAVMRDCLKPDKSRGRTAKKGAAATILLM